MLSSPTRTTTDERDKGMFSGQDSIHAVCCVLSNAGEADYCMEE